MQLCAPQQRFLHDMFTIESNGKNHTGADICARHCKSNFEQPSYTFYLRDGGIGVGVGTALQIPSTMVFTFPASAEKSDALNTRS